MARVLVTGAAGFIGFHVAKRLLARGDEVLGQDDLDPYYDVRLKEARLDLLRAEPGFSFDLVDVADRAAFPESFRRFAPEAVVHLAAQAGVRHSLDHPEAYVDANLVGFGNVLEACRHGAVRHLVFASSSSVYGANEEVPFSESHRVDRPVSLYAATKRANELMAHAYAHLFGLPQTALRFFTVYGPWGRPDMALFKFTQAILAGRPIEVFHHGRMRRDFTYVDDIVEGLVRVLDRPPAAGEAPPWRVYNLGASSPVDLMEMIRLLEAELGREAEKRFLPMQPGDVPASFASVEALARDVGYRPETPLAEGIRRFVAWYRSYYGV